MAVKLLVPWYYCQGIHGTIVREVWEFMSLQSERTEMNVVCQLGIHV